MEKKCRKCPTVATGESEIREKFHKDNSKLYGFANICKKCKNDLTSLYRTKNKAEKKI